MGQAGTLNPFISSQPEIDIIIYNNQNYVLDFLQTLIARIRSRNHTLLLVADEGVLNDRQLALVESIVDGSIELRSQERDVLILKYGGARTYRNSRYFFFGLVVGQYVVAVVWFVVDLITGMEGNMPFWI